jgi:hypothetical protein
LPACEKHRKKALDGVRSVERVVSNRRREQQQQQQQRQRKKKWFLAFLSGSVIEWKNAGLEQAAFTNHHRTDRLYIPRSKVVHL